MSDNLPERKSNDVLELLRRSGGMRIQELSADLGVTATAVRQRLNPLMVKGFVQRQLVREGRGRPFHRYEMTELGRRQTGSNFSDLATALWEEVRSMPDPEVRRGLLKRLSQRMANQYVDSVVGETPAARMESLTRLFAERDIPFEVQQMEGQLPVLKALGCPYTGLAETDRSVCAMERMMFGELVGAKLQLQECRLDGAHCCTFAMS